VVSDYPLELISVIFCVFCLSLPLTTQMSCRTFSNRGSAVHFA